MRVTDTDETKVVVIPDVLAVVVGAFKAMLQSRARMDRSPVQSSSQLAQLTALLFLNALTRTFDY